MILGFTRSLLKSSSRFLTINRMSSKLNLIDPTQKLLLDEQCIIVNDKDEVLGSNSKLNCHTVGKTEDGCILHRAFSVFLFNTQGELLLQQRSDKKVTFPLYYTNTCCSHPLYIIDELEEKDAIGVKKAARRRLEIELGIPQSQIDLNEIHYLTRIHYKASSDKQWGEHEIDYVLFIQKNVDLNPSFNEVREVKYVKRNEFRDFIKKLENDNVPVTPWFKLITDSFLLKWWDNLSNLSSFEDHKKIHRLC